MTNHPDHIARRHVEHDLATETFGPLHMYGIHEPVAVNDNVPVGYRRTEPKDGFAEDGLVPIDRYGPASVPAATQPAPPIPAYLAALPRDGFIYLGSPYSLYKAGHDEAARIVATATAGLMASGLRVYSPIAHGHFVSQHGKLPLTWEFWKGQCQPMIDAASSLIVLRMDGWTESVGLNYEIDEFTRARKPVLYLHPSEFGAAERRAAA